MNTWHHLPAIYFLHIPKTAGISIRAWLTDLYPDGAVLPADHLKEMEALPDTAIRSARLASGHFGWRLVERAEQLGKHFEVITFLRDVVSLRLSTLSYVTNLTEGEVEALGSGVAEETERRRNWPAASTWPNTSLPPLPTCCQLLSVRSTGIRRMSMCIISWTTEHRPSLC